MLSDYGKGSLAAPQTLIQQCAKLNVPVLVDPKGRDFDRYRDATLLTPNLAEFEGVAGECATDEALVEKGQALRSDLGIGVLAITLGERGLLLLQSAEPPEFLPARAREVFDVTGAGDTVIAAMAASIAAGATAGEAAAVANLAAGLVVQKIGVATVSRSELSLELHEHGQGGRGVLSDDAAIDAVREAQSRGERVVMTNGCFDILHTGHVAYLEEAKTRGDRLLVAVNSDASVARLKGAGRPVNPLDDRMSVLAGLASVDWVVAFDDDTPEALIRSIAPDVLVKGGDYEVSEIAGGQFVLENGGSVEVLGFREGRSTSHILDTIRRMPLD